MSTLTSHTAFAASAAPPLPRAGRPAAQTAANLPPLAASGNAAGPDQSGPQKLAGAALLAAAVGAATKAGGQRRRPRGACRGRGGAFNGPRFRVTRQAEFSLMDRKASEVPLEEENKELIDGLAEQVERINDREAEMDDLSNEELRARTVQIKERLAQNGGEWTDELIEESCALMREATWRVLELWYFDVQLLGGLVLHKGRLAEMKTGEGKTIVALIPTFLAALEDKGGCYVITPNDYLARRDAENVGQVLQFLGISVGLVQANMDSAERRTAYQKDVVYLTNAELGFDYLRDNLAYSEEEVVQLRPLHYCLVDEADSILIDEARTPLIISERVDALPKSYEVAKEVCKQLEENTHYVVDEKGMNVTMTDLGEKVATELLGISNIWDVQDGWILYVLNALKAKALFKPGEQYIVRGGQVCIVDSFSGRVLEGRRWSDGLHQSIECKEGMTVSSRSQTSASITYQSLFRLFPRLCGMTGTAMTENEEFDEIYGLRVTNVPTARPMVRRDYPDVVYKTVSAKIDAVVEEVVLSTEKNGRPVLIGTTSVKLSEEIVDRLKMRGVEPQLLNARKEAVMRESEIVAQAGRLGKVTVATNMAGRGTDIILGGNFSAMAQLKMRKMLADALPMEEEERELVPEIEQDFFPTEIPDKLIELLNSSVKAFADCKRGEACTTLLDLQLVVALFAGEAPLETEEGGEQLEGLREAYAELKALFKDALAEEKQEVIEAGGLYVVGTNRHESRRIDNQLRGRAGRQGDPGTTRFFISLEDDIFRVFGAEKVEGLMERFKLGDDVPLQSSVVNNALERVQKNVEEFFKKTRTTLFNFDEVLSRQRLLIYGQRRRLLMLESEKLPGEWQKMAKSICQNIVDKKYRYQGEEAVEKLKLIFDIDVEESDLNNYDKLTSLAFESIDKKWTECTTIRENFAEDATRLNGVRVVDAFWKDILRQMDALKQTVTLQAYKGQEPIKEYQVQGFDVFQKNSRNMEATMMSTFIKTDLEHAREVNAKLKQEMKERDLQTA